MLDRLGVGVMQCRARTGGAYAKGMSDKGGIFIQDHGHPVDIRNVWVKEIK